MQTWNCDVAASFGQQRAKFLLVSSDSCFALHAWRQAMRFSLQENCAFVEDIQRWVARTFEHVQGSWACAIVDAGLVLRNFRRQDVPLTTADIQDLIKQAVEQDLSRQ